MSQILRMFNKNTQITLTYSAPNILLKCYYYNSAAPIRLIVEKWPELTALRPFFSQEEETQCIIPVDQLNLIRSHLGAIQNKMQKQKRLIITIEDKVAVFVVREAPPDDFTVRYKWEQGHLTRVLPTAVSEGKDGWLLRGYEYWHYPKLKTDELELFQKKEITQRELLYYTRDYFPVFRDAGIHLESEIEYESTPAVQLSIHSILHESIHIMPHWAVAPDTIDENVKIPGHVISGHTLRTGILPGEMKQVLSDAEKDTVLKGEAIAVFHDRWYPIWKKWIDGDVASFEEEHQWIMPPYHWILDVQSRLHHGVGKPYAYPIACIGKERISVKELNDAQQHEYYQFSTGWVRREELLTLDLSQDGSKIGNVSANAFRLDEEQWLNKGNAKLDILWKGMVSNGPEWQADGNRHSIAKSHLEYLIYWGLNGGLSGGYDAFIAYGMPALVSHARKNEDCRILVLGEALDVDGLKAQYNENPLIRSKQICIKTYENIFQQSELLKTKWDIEALIEPEGAFTDKEKREAVTSAATGVTAACKLCFPYRYGDSGQDAECEQWIISLLNMKKKAHISQLVIRDSRKAVQLPKPYVFREQLPKEELYSSRSWLIRGADREQNRDVKVENQPEAVRLQSIVDDSRKKYISDDADKQDKRNAYEAILKTVQEIKRGKENAEQEIRQQAAAKQENENSHILVAAEPQNTYGTSSTSKKSDLYNTDDLLRSLYHDRFDTQAFFDEAKKLADYTVAQPETSVPFSEYFPTYSKLNRQQRAWYFYLRTCIRSGQYPQTDLSYLYIYIYELLSCIGATDVEDGYRRLMSLWYAYRGQYPSLDRHLSVWMVDYVHVYPCNIDIQRLMQDAPLLSENGMNIALSSMVEKEPLIMPKWMLEVLSQYRYSNSKFYQQGHQKLMDQVIPKTFEILDRKLREQNHKGLLDTYASLRWNNDTVTAFSDALSMQRKNYSIRVKHFQNGLILKKYISNVVRFTENELRKKENYSSRLQGVTLDENSSKIIRQYIQSLYVSSPEKRDEEKPELNGAQTHIVLNHDSVNQLRKESDEVRDILLATTMELQQDDPGNSNSDSVKNQAVDAFDAVHSIYEKCTASGRELLRLIRMNQWKMNLDDLKKHFSYGLKTDTIAEEINALAADFLGCPLLETEGNMLMVAEDYTEELSVLIDREEDGKRVWSVDREGLGEEWISFFRDVDLGALAASLQGKQAFKEYARKMDIMPEVLQDNINTLAQDTFGDLILDETKILDEYIDIVQTHLIKE